MVPTAYDIWRQTVIRIDNSLRAHQQEKQLNQQFTRQPFRFQPPHHPQPWQTLPQALAQAPPHPPPAGAYVGKGTGVAPMEGLKAAKLRQQRRCYRCGAPDHLARDCTNGRQNIRELVGSLEPEERFDLAQIMAALPESSFEEPKEEAVEEMIRAMSAPPESEKLDEHYDPPSSSSFPQTKQ